MNIHGFCKIVVIVVVVVIVVGGVVVVTSSVTSSLVLAALLCLLFGKEDCVSFGSEETVTEDVIEVESCRSASYLLSLRCKWSCGEGWRLDGIGIGIGIVVGIVVGSHDVWSFVVDVVVVDMYSKDGLLISLECIILFDTWSIVVVVVVVVVVIGPSSSTTSTLMGWDGTGW